MKKILTIVSALLLTVTTFAEVINIDITADQIATKYGWSTGEEHRTLILDGNVKAYVDENKSGSQSGFYYTGDWRIYQARVDSFWIEAENGATLETIQLTYTDGGKNATLSSVGGVNVDQSVRIASDSVLNVKGQTKVCLYVASTKSGVTSGQGRISRFRIAYNGVVAKEDPTVQFELKELYKRVNAAAFVNKLSNNSDGVVTYVSSNPAVATIANDGTITLVAEGETTITANVVATDKYNAGQASFTLFVRGENWKIETFDGAEDEGTGTYYTEVTTSAGPSNSTGLKWTTFLGSVKTGLTGFDGTAAVIRQRKSSESTFEPAYLLSSTITGGIDSLAFRWNSNGAESGNWNIAILVNNDTIAWIKETAGAVYTLGTQPRFTIGNLKRSGDFTLKFVNMAEVSTGTGNAKRFCIDNVEWYSYAAAPTALENLMTTEKAQKVIIDGVLYIRRGNCLFTALGQKIQ